MFNIKKSTDVPICPEVEFNESFCCRKGWVYSLLWALRQTYVKTFIRPSRLWIPPQVNFRLRWKHDCMYCTMSESETEFCENYQKTVDFTRKHRTLCVAFNIVKYLNTATVCTYVYIIQTYYNDCICVHQKFNVKLKVCITYISI